MEIFLGSGIRSPEDEWKFFSGLELGLYTILATTRSDCKKFLLTILFQMVVLQGKITHFYSKKLYFKWLCYREKFTHF